MIIAVDIRDLLQAKDPVFKGFITETLRRIAVKNPGHHFVFIINKGSQDLLLTGNNTEQVVAGRSAANPLFRKYWLNVQLPALLKKKGSCPSYYNRWKLLTGCKIAAVHTSSRYATITKAWQQRSNLAAEGRPHHLFL